MQAVILCGGKGTRLASLYSDRPKILVPIANRPFIEWQFEWLGRQGIKDIHLAGGYKAESLRTWIDEHLDTASQTVRVSSFSFSVTLSAEPIPLGTGGGIKFIAPWLIGDQFLAINGDSITPELNFRDLVIAQGQTGAAITLAASRINEAGRYGTVEFNNNGLITAFREKADRSDGWINAGVYLIEKHILATIADNTFTSLETEIFPALVKEDRLYAIPCPPPMLDMGTPEGISALEQWLTRESPR
jgi:NDP-sugar pyrophosphorylase family protein